MVNNFILVNVIVLTVTAFSIRILQSLRRTIFGYQFFDMMGRAVISNTGNRPHL